MAEGASARKDRVDLLGAGLLVTISLLLGLNQSLIRIVNDGLHPVFQAGLRSALAAPLILLAALWMRRRVSVADGTLGAGVVVGVLFALEFMLMFTAIDLTAVARASIFFYTMPFWMALGAHFLIPGEGLTPRRLIGLGLAIAGVALAFAGEPIAAPGPNALLGDVMALGAAVFWAAIGLVARTTRLSRATPEMQLLYQLVISAPLLLALAAFVGPSLRAPTPEIWAIFAFQVVVIVGFGFVAWFWVLSIYPASDMASYSFLAPVFSVIFAWAILGEEITLTILAALALVGAGIFLVNWKPKPRSGSS